MRLKEVEAKNVETLLARKAEIKAFAMANGGKIPKDDGQGIVIRKELTGARNKLRIIRKKIKKFGEMGKIPMGAGHRIYHEQSSDSESSSAETSEEDLDSSNSLDSDGQEKEKKVKIKKRKPELLSSTLVFQPTFTKVVKESSTNLGRFKDLLKLDSAIERDK